MGSTHMSILSRGDPSIGTFNDKFARADGADPLRRHLGAPLFGIPGITLFAPKPEFNFTRRPTLTENRGFSLFGINEIGVTGDPSRSNRRSNGAIVTPKLSGN